MIESRLTKLAGKATRCWDKATQVTVAIEELGELIHALARSLNGREHNVQEEIVDMAIMLEQLKIIYGFDPLLLEQKLDKLEAHLNRQLQ